MVRLLVHMFFLPLAHLSLHGHQTWLRRTVTCALIHAYSMIADIVTITLSPLQSHRYTEHCIAHKYLLHSISLIDVVSPLHRYRDSRHYYCMFVNYWYTDTLVHWIPSCAQLLHVLTSLFYRRTGIHALIVFVFLLHDHGFIPVTWIMDLVLLHRSWFIWLLHGYACILVTWWFPVTDIDIPITGLENCWYTICGIPHLLFPFPVILFPFPVILFYAINRAQVRLSCYPYHVL